MKKKVIKLVSKGSYVAIVKVGGEAVGVIMRNDKKNLEKEVVWFKKACKDIWKGEVVTVKYKEI